ncbi:MAG: tyrosine-type recombinase/integrase [Bacteroidales bacterium]|nr:tyrosine-type recombinase/integrase [Bacteroidales bacterium]
MLLEDFKDYLRIKRRYSERTVALYTNSATDYLQFVYPEKLTQPTQPVTDQDLIDALNYQLIRGYVAHCLDNNLNPRTVNLKLSALSTLCSYLVKQQQLTTNPVKDILRPKEKKRLPSFFTEDSIKAYLDSPIATDNQINNTYQALRNRLIITLLFDTGLRRAEATSLKLSDIDLSRKTITIIGKGNKQRSVPLIDSLCEKIGDYLTLRSVFLKTIQPDNQPTTQTDAFFLTDTGKPIYLEFINRVVKSELTNAHLAGKKTPHTLRHSFATALLNDGADLNSIKEVLGHSSLAATEVYTHNSFEKLKEIYNTAHPRANKK